jgi:transcriptional regulator with XRE-family HTH domain
MTTRPEPRGAVEAALGARFRLMRRQQKVSLLAVAQGLGCSINTVRWHEAGARMLRTDDLVRAALIIGVDPAELTRTEEGTA